MGYITTIGELKKGLINLLDDNLKVVIDNSTQIDNEQGGFIYQDENVNKPCSEISEKRLNELFLESMVDYTGKLRVVIDLFVKRSAVTEEVTKYHNHMKTGVLSITEYINDFKGDKIDLLNEFWDAVDAAHVEIVETLSLDRVETDTLDDAFTAMRTIYEGLIGFKPHLDLFDGGNVNDNDSGLSEEIPEYSQIIREFFGERVNFTEIYKDTIVGHYEQLALALFEIIRIPNSGCEDKVERMTEKWNIADVEHIEIIRLLDERFEDYKERLGEVFARMRSKYEKFVDTFNK